MGWKRLAVAGALMVLASACVTINIYFPEAKAEEAIKAIVEDVLGTEEVPAEKKNGSREDPAGRRLALNLLDWLVPPAQAAEPDFTVESPEIRRIQAQMKSRQSDLKPFYDSGAIGFTRDGLVEIRDSGAVSLKERNRLQQLVNQENSDRSALYKAIAKANGHPEWESNIQGVFGEQWIKEAPQGWWYRDASGTWKQK
ncbi:MAG: YdbL family protein [Chromatiales bacterium]|jgi:uncharacterized protein YdbL (DUF1318 family)